MREVWLLKLMVALVIKCIVISPENQQPSVMSYFVSSSCRRININFNDIFSSTLSWNWVKFNNTCSVAYRSCYIVLGYQINCFGHHPSGIIKFINIIIIPSIFLYLYFSITSVITVELCLILLSGGISSHTHARTYLITTNSIVGYGRNTHIHTHICVFWASIQSCVISILEPSLIVLIYIYI